MRRLILQLLKEKNLTKERVNDLKRGFCGRTKQAFPAAAELFQTYRQLLKLKKLKPLPALEKILKKRGVRTLSGVAVVTVLTKPWPCPGRCVYCPSQAGLPKSYLKNEPAAQRAYFNNFDPYNQVFSRLKMLFNNGHPTDKIELIIKGGSWNAYPLAYQTWFVKECFRAANDFNPKIKKPRKQKPRQLPAQLLWEQKRNEKARGRVIGLTLETRPDLINEKTIWQMRRLGCTRVELGVQHTDDEILRLVRRGHALSQTKKAIALLRSFGFKIDFHLMPQLPDSTPKKDWLMFKQIFSDPALRPDMIKIYPCAVVANSELYNWFKRGRYKPYSSKKLAELLIQVKAKIIPPYCRVSRLIRDIPATEIVAGNKITNLRQYLQEEMKKRGLKCRCLRCREIGHQKEWRPKDKSFSKAKLFIQKYETSGGKEYFLSFEDEKRRVVFAFCRLRLDQRGFYPAFIRELHTYGQLLPLGERDPHASQHRGLGKKLLRVAEKIARQEKSPSLAVIAGVGARDYYRKTGFRLKNTYLIKKLS
ncbi:MAG: tRNA uridine(34) 5-carboxymethylaminomethyl modification radical SAM/GNAT enzyme Elp3 [Candidatus Magasanikbacteria bacterium]|nr:tRNA uridine(34) 5-carboxymethylaminomethyl modification radical SAM/GNAT enzyme Elp3 [Candidatus Magasanikbacteria bacterium]